MKNGLQIVFAAVLGWLAVVGSGCAGAWGNEAHTGVQPVPSADGASYARTVEIFAQAAHPLLSLAHDGDASSAAESEGCDLAGVYDGALYSAEEPLASKIELVSAEEDCNKEDIACNRRCMNNPNPPYPNGPKGSRAHVSYCQRKCHAEYMNCMRNAGLLTFAAMDAALGWLKSHGKEILGTFVVVGALVYVVATAGSGALVLVAL